MTSKIQAAGYAMAKQQKLTNGILESNNSDLNDFYLRLHSIYDGIDDQADNTAQKSYDPDNYIKLLWLV